MGIAAGAWQARTRPAILVPAACLFLGLLVFATPFNHDEDQYLAASVLAARLRPYADFLYVQTPLQPELTAPLVALLPGRAFLAMRVFSAACGLAALAGVWTAVRRLGRPREAAGAAAFLTASCYTFQYCSGVARNDALPTALLGWGLAMAAAALREDARRPALGWTLAALLLGAAVSAKLSFAPLLAVAGAFVGWRLVRRPEPSRRSQAAGFGLGAALGLSPVVQAWIAAPEAVRFALFGFWAGGPQRWYVANGLQHQLEPASKLLHGLGVLALGPALAALVILLADGWRRRNGGLPGPRDPDVFLNLMVAAGLVAAFVPSPTYKQYFAPLLPPLFIRLCAGPPGLLRPPWTRAALALGAALGLYVFAFRLGAAAWTGRWAPADVARENRWVSDVLRAAHVRGEVATLSAHAVLDSGWALDRRFAGGAMVYRSADGIDPALRARLHVTAPASLAADLDRTPPAAIVTGYEDGGGDVRVRLDEAFRAYARDRGYSCHPSPSGPADLYIRPRAPTR